MNLLELQQRANVLVQKVNEYEANLTGTEIDETDTLNQHIYADLYCLRPVMKLLFGATVDEKLNRTLDNDVALRVFASSAPAWNSTFNLLSSLQNISEAIENTLTVNTSQVYTTTQVKISENENIDDIIEYAWSCKIGANGQNYSNINLLNCGLSDKTSSTGSNIGSRLYIWNALGEKLQLGLRDDINNVSYDFYEMPITNPKSDLYFNFKLIINTKTNVLKMINYDYNNPEVIINEAEISLPGEDLKWYKKYTNVTLHQGMSAVSGSTYSTFNITTYQSPDVDYQSDQHQFMNNIDMYNQYNMCQLDVTQNSITSKTDRVRLGINNSYSSNIADALVTESQVANIFNWNTTNSEAIVNNTMSVNRQVPGIVCYYLGNNYNSTYTATIPYAPRTDNINSINYGNPPYYGAFYRNGTDISQSQVGLSMGAEACRIFMPGLNYTRGKLESPQQIWQPDKKIGDDNIDLGFNWQGRAIYHELVFKNRRAGCSDANVDFKPTLDSVADNDPQGLATRFALAQQKPYYYNRPWFNELDELYGVDPSKLVDYINNNSINIPDSSQPVFDKSRFTIVGSASLSDDGMLTNTSATSYATLDIEPLNLNSYNDITIISPIFTSNTAMSSFAAPSKGLLTLWHTSSTITERSIYTISGYDSDWSGTRGSYADGAQSSSISSDYNSSLPYVQYELRIVKENNLYKFSATAKHLYDDFTVGASKNNLLAITISANPFSGTLILGALQENQSIPYMDLKPFKIVDNTTGKTLFESISVPGTTSMNDAEFYKNYKLDYNTWAGALNKPL